jgi:signal transduction histidine kinase
MPSAHRAARRLLSTRTALAVGFGVLLTLLVLSGLNAMAIISRLRARNEDIVGTFLRAQNRLDELRSKIYLSGTYIRDYLLEPDAAKAEESRVALAQTRREIQDLTSETGAPLGDGADATGHTLYNSLQQEVREYWRALDPVLAWSPQQRHQKGYRFLHDEVLPRRSGMLRIADTIVSLNQQQLMERDHRLVEMFAGLQTRLAVAIAAMFLGGLVLAFIAAIHILRLESQMLAHLRQVTSARQELRHLSARLVESQENERKNISRELHDAVGQSMSAVQFELHDLCLALAGYPPPLQERVSRIRELVESSVAMVRNMALLLRPSMLDDLGLPAALEWQANQVSRSTGIRVRIAVDSIPAELPEEHKICIFRVVQEALNNICRHARANTAEIRLWTEGETLCVTIRDDGRGFHTPHRTGLGLLGMEERAKSLGGTMAVRSEQGKGTNIEIALPLPQQAVSPHDPAPAQASPQIFHRNYIDPGMSAGGASSVRCSGREHPTD